MKFKTIIICVVISLICVCVVFYLNIQRFKKAEFEKIMSFENEKVTEIILAYFEHPTYRDETKVYTPVTLKEDYEIFTKKLASIIRGNFIEIEPGNAVDAIPSCDIKIKTEQRRYEINFWTAPHGPEWPDFEKHNIKLRSGFNYYISREGGIGLVKINEKGTIEFFSLLEQYFELVEKPEE